MKKLLLCLAVAMGLSTHAQQFEVVSLQQVNTGTKTAAYHPRFMPDGNLLVSEENYDGLGIVNVKTGTYTNLTNMRSAGYYPAISEDGKTIIVHEQNPDLTNNLHCIDVASRAVTTVVSNIDHINQVNFSNGNLTYAVKSSSVTRRVSNAISSRLERKVLVTEENLKIVVYRNGKRTVLDPLAGQMEDNWDPQYTWTSLSPNGQKILFGCADNAYVCNLDGSGLVNLGALRAPAWRGNTHVVGMLNADDGYYYTSSEIVIVKADGTGYQQLTSSSSEIKVFPSASADGSQIAFHTLEGKIYIMTIKEK